MANKNISPCMGCKDRQLNCHSVCADYKAFRDNLDSINDTIKKSREEYKINGSQLNLINKRLNKMSR